MFESCFCHEIDCYGTVVMDHRRIRARKAHVCGECRRVIRPGEVYEFQKLLDGDKSFSTHNTCIPCSDVRDSMFKCGYYFGEVWQDIHESYCTEDFCLCPESIMKDWRVKFICARPKAPCKRERHLHYLRAYSAEPPKCGCGSKMKPADPKEVAVYTGTGKKPFRCPSCGHVYRSQSAMRIHAEEEHELYIPTLPECHAGITLPTADRKAPPGEARLKKMEIEASLGRRV